MIYAVCAFVVVTSPGTVLTIRAETSCGARAEAQIVVVSPLRWTRPVYVPARVRVSSLPDGTRISVIDHLCDGMRVRVPVCVGQSVQWFDGIQLYSGEVWINGFVVRPYAGRLDVGL